MGPHAGSMGRLVEAAHLHDERRKDGVRVDDDGAAAGEAPHHGDVPLQHQRAVKQLVHLPVAREPSMRPMWGARSRERPLPRPPLTLRCP
jgi:hypothetical protein